MYEAAVAQTLGNIASVHRHIGHLEVAIKSYEEVARILRALRREDSNASVLQLGGCLSNLGSTLFLSGDLCRARDVLAEAVEQFEYIVQREPEAYTYQLAGAVNNLSLTLSAMGLGREAIEAAWRAVSLAEGAADHLPLSKGDVAGAYWLIATERVREGSAEGVYEVLAALRDANLDAVHQALRHSPAVVHFSGHGDIVRSEAALVLWGGVDSAVGYALFDRRSLSEARCVSGRDRLLPRASVVVLNSCWSGRSRAFGGAREDLAAAFIKEGAMCVVACPTPVHDDVGKLLATLLYVPELQDERGWAYTFSRVRTLIAQKLEDTPLWWTWVWMRFHGNPFGRMSSCSDSGRGRGGRGGRVWPSRALDLVRDLLK